MTEPEYILAGDLRTVRQVLVALREVMPELNPSIPDEEYRTVIRLLAKWQDALFAAVVIDAHD